MPSPHNCRCREGRDGQDGRQGPQDNSEDERLHACTCADETAAPTSVTEARTAAPPASFTSFPQPPAQQSQDPRQNTSALVRPAPIPPPNTISYLPPPPPPPSQLLNSQRNGGSAYTTLPPPYGHYPSLDLPDHRAYLPSFPWNAQTSFDGSPYAYSQPPVYSSDAGVGGVVAPTAAPTSPSHPKIGIGKRIR
jgi:hypothetical protein